MSYSEKTPIVTFPDFFEGQSTKLSVARARRWELGLPTDWLQGDFLKLQIQGLQSRDIENPPQAYLDSFSSLLLRLNSNVYQGEQYFPYVSLQNRTEGQSCGEPIVIPSRDLLPQRIREFYGYSGNDFECHRTAFVYNFDPVYSPNISSEDRVFDFVRRTFQKVKDGDELQLGDHVFIQLLMDESGLGEYKEDDENAAIQHSVVYIAPGIVFSKNGNGRSVPFYLQSSGDVYEKYTNARKFNRIGNIEAWRTNFNFQ